MSKMKKLGRQGKTIFRKDGKVHRGIEDEGVDWSRKRIEDVQRRIEEDEMIRDKCRQRKEDEVDQSNIGEKKMMEMIRKEKNREFRMRREMMRAQQAQMQMQDNGPKSLADGIFSVGQSAMVLGDHLSNQPKPPQHSTAKRCLEEELKTKEDDPEHNKKDEAKILEKLRAENNKEFRMRREQMKLENSQTKNIASGLFMVGNSAMVIGDRLSTNQPKPNKPSNSPNVNLLTPNLNKPNNSPNVNMLTPKPSKLNSSPNLNLINPQVLQEGKHEWEAVEKEPKTPDMLRAESNREFRMRREQMRLENTQAKNIASGLFLVGNSAMVINDRLPTNQPKPGKQNHSPNMSIVNPNFPRDGKEGKEKVEKEGMEKKVGLTKVKKDSETENEEPGGCSVWLEEFVVWYFKFCCCV